MRDCNLELNLTMIVLTKMVLKASSHVCYLDAPTGIGLHFSQYHISQQRNGFEAVQSNFILDMLD